MIKRLARCIREFKKAAILAPVTMIGEVAMEVLVLVAVVEVAEKFMSRTVATWRLFVCVVVWQMHMSMS